MRKLFYLMMLIVILGLIIPGCTFHVVPPLGQDGSTDIVKGDVSYKTNLIAGQHTIAGSITVSNDDEKLCVKYQLSPEAILDGWRITETHLAVADSEEGIPQNKKGIPIPGKFPYGDDELGSVEFYEECISFADLGVEYGDDLVIAAHAIIEKEECELVSDEEVCTIYEESAWGDGIRFVQNGDWAMCFEYQITGYYEHYLQIGNEAIEEVVALTEQYGKTQAYQMIVDYLLEKEGISDAGVTPDGECVWYELDNGFTFSFSEYSEDDTLSSGKTSPDDSQSIIRNPSRATPDNNKAIILDWEFLLDDTPNTVRNCLEIAGYLVDYCPKSLSLFTLEKVMDLYQYGVVYICSHALSGEKKGIKIVTGEKLTPQTSYYYRKTYGDDIMGSKTGAHTVYLIQELKLINLGTFWCFYPDFIRHFATNEYPDSLIYADVCHGYDDYTMAKAFIDSGAYVYSGYIGITRVGCKHDENVFKWLTIDNLSLREAITKCADGWLCGSLRYYPKEDPDHGDFYFGEANHAPVISSLTAEPSSININQITTITCTATDEDFGDFLYFEYTWGANGGSFEGDTSGPSVTWRAPSTDGNYTITCEVSDGELSDSEQVVITITSYPVHNLTKNTYYTTIQVAIDNADSGNTIEVSPGIYYENINFMGKNITLKSTNPNDPNVVSSTIIDGGGNGSVVTFISGETAQAVLSGFTIQNGNAGTETGGGGIFILSSSPVISNNIVKGNITHSDHGGGGIFIAHSASPLIENNNIYGNQGGYGGGIYVGYNSSPTIRNNTIENNSAEIHRGGGIFISGSSSPTIQDNSLSDNSSQYGGGICIVENSSGEITNNYFTLNTAQYGGGIFCGDSDPIIKENEFYENSATSFGGGLFIGECVVNNNVISGNTAQTGGGIFVWESSPTISDNTISGNTTTMSGGGIYVRSNSHPTINNNIISLNTTTMDGGGLYIDSNSSVKTTNGSTWPRQNTPPNTEATNTYFDNTHGNPLDYTEGADVYMVGAITPINGDITNVSPLTDPFTLGTWYTTYVYVKNTGNTSHTFKVIASEPSGTDFEITQKNLSLNVGASSSASFKYQFYGTETCRTLTFKLYDSSNNLLKTYTTGNLCPEPTTVSAPTGVDATDGTYTDKVKTTWNSVSGATHYKVYRARSSGETKVALSGWQTGTSYDDTSADFCWFYSYWVKAATSSSGANASGYSDYNTGWRRLEAPQNVTASIGEVGKTVISWDPVERAVYYRVYRGLSTGSKIPITDWFQTATYQYNDYTGEVNKYYWYWVKAAYNTSGLMESDWSDPVLGYRK